MHPGPALDPPCWCCISSASSRTDADANPAAGPPLADVRRQRPTSAFRCRWQASASDVLLERRPVFRLTGYQEVSPRLRPSARLCAPWGRRLAVPRPALDGGASQGRPASTRPPRGGLWLRGSASCLPRPSNSDIKAQSERGQAASSEPIARALGRSRFLWRARSQARLLMPRLGTEGAARDRPGDAMLFAKWPGDTGCDGSNARPM